MQVTLYLGGRNKNKDLDWRYCASNPFIKAGVATFQAASCIREILSSPLEPGYSLGCCNQTTSSNLQPEYRLPLSIPVITQTSESRSDSGCGACVHMHYIKEH